MLAYASDRSGEGQSGHLGSADSRRPSGQADPSRRRRSRALVLGRWKPDRFSIQPARRRHLYRPDAGWRRAASRRARLFAALFTRRKVDRLRRCGTGRQPNLRGASRRRSSHACRRRFLSGSGTRLVARRPTSAVLGAAPARRSAGEQRRLVRGGDPRRVARPDGRARALLREEFQAFQGLPSPDAWVRAGNRILFHGNVGDSSNMWQVAIAPERWRVSGSAAAGDVRHDRRSGRLGHLGRTNGVHQPDDGGRHLEPADRRKPRRGWRDR